MYSLIEKFREGSGGLNFRIEKKEAVVYFMAGIVVSFLIGWLFFKNIVVSSLFCICPILLYPLFRQTVYNRKKEEMNMQFKDVLYAFSDAAASGKSAQLSIENAYRNLGRIYGEKNVLTENFGEMAVKIKETNAAPEKVLLDFGLDCDVEDIRNFIEIYTICLKSGGDREKAITKAASIIGEKINLRLELRSILAQKKLEAAILCSITPIILLFLQITSSEYTTVLYTTLAGRIIMCGCLGATAFAASKCLKIMDIRI